ncbi:fimbrial biogenesis chaperone [Rosenbergiella nectarea]|uniref:fimbrial biogenesis chaperone n=1 Tax=Rosenbergiella nectarea TaxID=988801 RepID=UPI001F4E4500|nr:fimbria/pilus periplasmic chaperone [Rosenbergiella nectarea]
MKKYLVKLSFLALLLSQGAFAGALRLSPINLAIDDDQRATTLTIFNQSSEAENIQIRAFAWMQDNQGNDKLSATNDVAVSPSVVAIAPNGSFNVRIVRQTSGKVSKEQAYRIVVDELPKPNDSRKNNGNINILLRTLLPLFVGNDELLQVQDLKVSNHSGGCQLQVNNSGQRHILLSQVGIIDSSTQRHYPVATNPVNGYLLPSITKYYEITGLTHCNDNNKLQINATINGKHFNY